MFESINTKWMPTMSKSVGLTDIFKPIQASDPGSLFGEGYIRSLEANCGKPAYERSLCLVAKEVIFAPPATIVYWDDGTRTVVKCSDDDYYNEEFGLALCFMKKAHGNTGHYNDVIRRLIKNAKIYGCDKPLVNVEVKHESTHDTSDNDNSYINITDTWNSAY